MLIRFELDNDFGNATYVDNIHFDYISDTEMVSVSTFKAYPNPAFSEQVLEFPPGVHIRSWQLSDQAGKQLRKGQTDNLSNSLTINRKALPAGMYYLQMQLVTGQRVVQKIVFID